MGIDEATALLRAPDGSGPSRAPAGVHVFVDGSRAELSALSGELNPLLTQD